MRSYIFEGTVTALSSIHHNGGDKNGTVSQLRREKFVQPNGTVKEVPIISGNAIRGILRDRGMFQMLRELGYGVNEETGEVKGLSLNAFYFLFSGGALVSTGKEGLDVGDFQILKELIPLVGIFGGAKGNAIMPGKMDMGKMYPICKELSHLLPPRFMPEQPQTIWDYCQVEMFTRRDDAKNDRVLPMLESSKPIVESNALFSNAEISTLEKKEEKKAPQQMIYNVETLAAGTQLYWKIVLRDVTDIEFEAFIATMLEFSKHATIGGKAATGHGEIAIHMENWLEIDSRASLNGKEVDFVLGTKYSEHLKNRAYDIQLILNSMA